MTRGTIFVVLPNDELRESLEFNGGMYGSTKDDLDSRTEGLYKDVIHVLMTVVDESSFKFSINKFNKKNFDYDEKMVCEVNADVYKNFDGEYRAGHCKSDYSFWKNCSGSKIEIVDEDGVVVELIDGEIATFNWGKYIESFDTNKESWKNMFKRFRIV